MADFQNLRIGSLAAVLSRDGWAVGSRSGNLTTGGGWCEAVPAWLPGLAAGSRQVQTGSVVTCL